MSDTLKQGALARIGLLDGAALRKAGEVLDRVAADGLETVRVLFCDQHGVLRGKTLVAGALGAAFTTGVAVPSTLLLKDTSHRTVFPVWSPAADGQADALQGARDVLLVPDPGSFRVLPWAPHSAWLLCDVVHKSGAPIAFSSRRVLQTALDALAAGGYGATIGLEVEFHVFQMVDPALAHSQTTMPTQPPQTRALIPGYQFLTEDRYGDAEDVLDHLRRMAQGLGLPVRSVEIEMGPSQFEFTFDPAGPMQHADNLVMFRSMVKRLCAARGLHATFMAKPRVENGAASGWHIHQSLSDLASGRAVFVPGEDGVLTPEASGWIAGLLDHASASSLLVSPTVNSYKRYQPYQLAPNRIQWGHDNRGAMVRALMGPGDSASRVENRAPDTAANPYFALAAQILSGLDGILQGKTAPPATEDPYDPGAPMLPTDLGAAIGHFENSAFYRKALGDSVVDYLVHLKRAEWQRYLASVSEWEQAEYFSLF